MPDVWTLLPYLICPLAMGGAMWLLMRHTKNVPPGAPQELTLREPVEPAAEPAVTRPLAPMPAPARRMVMIGGICLNPQVIAGLALVGGGVWVLAPNLMWAALPLLLMAACPLSMLLMMRGGQGGHAAASEPARELISAGQARDEQLAALQMALARTQARQEEIAREIARLHTEQAPAASTTEGAAATNEPIPARF